MFRRFSHIFNTSNAVLQKMSAKYNLGPHVDQFADFIPELVAARNENATIECTELSCEVIKTNGEVLFLWKPYFRSLRDLTQHFSSKKPSFGFSYFKKRRDVPVCTLHTFVYFLTKSQVWDGVQGQNRLFRWGKNPKSRRPIFSFFRFFAKI